MASNQCRIGLVEVGVFKSIDGGPKGVWNKRAKAVWMAALGPANVSASTASSPGLQGIKM